MSDSSGSDLESANGDTEQISRDTPSNSGGNNRRRQLFDNPLSDKTNVLILEEMKKTNSSLSHISSRIDQMESRLKTVEQQQKDSPSVSSSGGSSAEKTKRKVPTRVRVRIWILCVQYLEGYRPIIDSSCGHVGGII